MPDHNSHTKHEREMLSIEEARQREEACQRAEKFMGLGGQDPYPDIPCALLAAEHIRKYVEITGMIAPFFPEGGDKSRMKKASYQGRMEKSLTSLTKKGKLVPIQIDKDRKKLVIKANSIVFVECDIDFRLPDFIAMRFNLHIRHVHRGLLLGTGPLVDPGYWGKLCIPLHNLTDEDYPIPVKKGLIWMEFTKTSHKPNESTEGRNPNSEEFLDIREFITRSASQYGIVAVPIRSSIPLAIKEARGSVKSAEESAKSAEKQVRRLSKRGYIGGIIGLSALVISFTLLTYGAFRNVQSAYHSVESQYQRVRFRISHCFF